MNLADPALADAKHRANFLQVELFLVVEAQHQLFSLRKLLNCLCQAFLECI
jgi:phenylalanyl-tRNA synthetase alpha subunit